MVTGESQPYDHLYLNKCLIPFSANGDQHEMTQMIFNYLFQAFVKNDRIQSQLVGQFLFPDMSLVMSDSGMRRARAIQQAIYLLKVMFRWIQLLAITGERCNNDFMLNLLEIMSYFVSF